MIPALLVAAWGSSERLYARVAGGWEPGAVQGIAAIGAETRRVAVQLGAYRGIERRSTLFEQALGLRLGEERWVDVEIGVAGRAMVWDGPCKACVDWADLETKPTRLAAHLYLGVTVTPTRWLSVAASTRTLDLPGPVWGFYDGSFNLLVIAGLGPVYATSLEVLVRFGPGRRWGVAVAGVDAVHLIAGNGPFTLPGPAGPRVGGTLMAEYEQLGLEVAGGATMDGPFAAVTLRAGARPSSLARR